MLKIREIGYEITLRKYKHLKRVGNSKEFEKRKQINF